MIAVNPRQHPQVKYELALKFIDYITGAEGQKIIADYKVDGDQIFSSINRISLHSRCREGVFCCAQKGRANPAPGKSTLNAIDYGV